MGKEESFLFIRGHLYLEALLGEIILRSYPEPQALNDISVMFYRKVKLVRAVGRLTTEMEDLLLSINTLRNKIAHKLDFGLDFDSVYELILKAHKADIDFSDDMIYLNKDESMKNYGIDLSITELMSNTFSELIYSNEDLFSQDDISRFLC
ncbi:hypothetical protein SDC9_167398 [bioreactor metagenome]|uniref:DUF4145 domain-containing protein n=1 Tax=bioreactor metagenome TaxID=1076179 RepID=A0A645G249_9ZZZZ